MQSIEIKSGADKDRIQIYCKWNGIGVETFLSITREAVRFNSFDLPAYKKDVHWTPRQLKKAQQTYSDLME